MDVIVCGPVDVCVYVNDVQMMATVDWKPTAKSSAVKVSSAGCLHRVSVTFLSGGHYSTLESSQWVPSSYGS